MSLANYGELRREIANWLMRPDLETVIPSFIAMAESAVNRTVRAQDMVTRSQATLTENFTRLPDDWQEAWNIQIAGGKPLQYLPPAEMDAQRTLRREHAKAEQGTPEFYSIIGNTIELLPAPPTTGVVLEMIYFASVPPMTSDTAQNWLLRRHPDIYVYGALIHSAPFLVDDSRLPVWQGLYDTAVAQLSEAQARSRRSGAPLRRPN